MRHALYVLPCDAVSVLQLIKAYSLTPMKAFSLNLRMVANFFKTPNVANLNCLFTDFTMPRRLVVAQVEAAEAVAHTPNQDS